MNDLRWPAVGAAMLGALVVLGACAGDSGPGNTGPDSLGVQPDEITIPVQSQRLAVGLIYRGNTITYATTWEVANPSVASVQVDASSYAKIVGLSPGTTWVYATEGDLIDSLPLTVEAVDSILAVPDTIRLKTGEKDWFYAAVYGGTSVGLAASWRVDNPSVASFTEQQVAGEVTALAGGTAHLIAEAGTLADTVTVIVTGTPPLSSKPLGITPDSLTLIRGASGNLSVTDSLGAVIPPGNLLWTSTNPFIATVASDGTVHAVRRGSTLVVASMGNHAAIALVTVVDDLTLEVIPADTTIPIFGTAEYRVVALDGSGDTVPAPPVVWTSSDSGIAKIDSNGVATGLTAGQTNIVATAGVISSDPARLVVAAGAGACYGIGSATRFTGTMAYGFKVVDAESDGGFLISADDNGSLFADLTVQTVTPFLASWYGEVSGASSASVTQKRTSESGMSTYNSTSGVILPQPAAGLPKFTLIVDMQTCNYRVISGASIATVLVDEFGNHLNSVDIVSEVQFAGAVPQDWRANGISRANGTMAAHSVVYAGLHLNESALMPLGFVPELFNQGEVAVGQASGGFTLINDP